MVSCVFDASAQGGEGVLAVQKQQPATEAALPGKTALKNAYQSGFAGNFLSGKFAKSQQDLDKASHYWQESLNSAPQNARFTFEAMHSHVLAGNIRKAQKLAESLPDRLKQESLAGLLLVVKYADAHHYDKALLSLKDINNKGIFEVLRPAMRGWLMLAKQHNAAPAVALDEEIERAGFFAPFLHYQQGLMHQVAGNLVQARAHLERAITQPDSAPYRVADMLLRLYLRMGEEQKAKVLAEQFNAANMDAVFTLDLERTRREKAWHEVTTAQYGLAELFFTTASILFGDDISSETLVYLRLALHLRPNFAPAQFMLAHVYERQGAYDRAFTVYNSIRPDTVFFARSQLRKVLNLNALKRHEEALKLLETLIQQTPSNVALYVTKGDLLRQRKLYEEAAKAYSEALLKAKARGNQHWSVHYARGICYERMGRWEDAEEDFLAALTLEPDQPDVLNYLAYSWLLQGKNLEKARNYLQIAVSLRPEDAHIIDSMGWAHYVLGDFETAAHFLEKAVELNPLDAAVHAHLGDVYWRLGRELEAQYQWRHALSNNPDIELKEAVLLKLSEGLPPFLLQTPAKAFDAKDPLSQHSNHKPEIVAP